MWVFAVREGLMDTKGRLIAGSHNRNEFILINADEVARVSPLIHDFLIASSNFYAEKSSYFRFSYWPKTHLSTLFSGLI